MARARVIIGVGNPDRGDDSIGPAIAEQLRAHVGGGVKVVTQSGEVTALLDCLEQAEAAYLIDAVSSGAAPGTVHRFDVSAAPLPSTSFAASTHGLGLAEAIELARAMDCLPPCCIVYAIEGADFGEGHPLSAAVAAAEETVAAQILAELGTPYA